MRTYIFPGQGSQARGMGAGLFEAFPDMTAKADEILGYSIKELCLDDPRNDLHKTQYTQPALFVVNALSYRRKLEQGGPEPDYLAGHSLGEYNALLAAGCFDFEAGLRLVAKRGELMSQAASGAMAAILNATKDEVETILRENGLSNIDLANYNTPTQIVISGVLDEINKAQHCFQGKMLFYPLNTSGPFHSRFMRTAQAEFESYLRHFDLAPPRIPVIANISARPYEADAVASTLSTQISSTVRWSESIQYLMQVAGDEDMEFEEIGNGEVLTKLVRSIKQSGRAGALPPAARPAAQVQEPAPAAAAAGAPASKPDAVQRVREWNTNYPVGTKVKSVVPGYGDLETRTEAIVLFGHRAAVYMKGYNGYFDLEELC